MSYADELEELAEQIRAAHPAERVDIRVSHAGLLYGAAHTLRNLNEHEYARWLREARTLTELLRLVLEHGTLPAWLRTDIELELGT